MSAEEIFYKTIIELYKSHLMKQKNPKPIKKKLPAPVYLEQMLKELRQIKKLLTKDPLEEIIRVKEPTMKIFVSKKDLQEQAKKQNKKTIVEKLNELNGKK